MQKSRIVPRNKKKYAEKLRGYEATFAYSSEGNCITVLSSAIRLAGCPKGFDVSI